MKPDKSISINEIKNIFQLSKLLIAEHEIDKILAEFNQIIQFFNTLDEVDTTDVEELNQVNSLSNIHRADSIKEAFSRETALSLAPDHSISSDEDNMLFKVPAVIGS